MYLDLSRILNVVSREIRTRLYDDIFYNVKYRAIYVPVEHRSHEESDGDLTGNLVQRGKYICRDCD